MKHLGIIRVERKACSGMWRWWAWEGNGRNLIDKGISSTRGHAEAYAKDAVKCRAEAIEKDVAL